MVRTIKIPRHSSTSLLSHRPQSTNFFTPNTYNKYNKNPKSHPPTNHISSLNKPNYCLKADESGTDLRRSLTSPQTMGNTTTTIACVSCQSFCLKPATSGTNLESLLADAEINRYAVSGMRVVKLNRDGLMRLGKRLGYPPRYKVMVDNHQSLDIKQYDLFKYSLIIVKVINNRIMIRCLEDGQEPRKGRDLDWEKIRKYANSGYYDDWNLGYKWIWKGRDLDWEKIRKYANLGYYDYWNLGYGWIWKGRDLDWEKIRKYANLGYYDYWNLGSGWICQRPEPTEIGKWMEQKPTNNMPRFRAV